MTKHRMFSLKVYQAPAKFYTTAGRDGRDILHVCLPATTTGKKPPTSGANKITKLAKKGSKHSYTFLREKINRGSQTKQSEDRGNRMLGKMQTIQLFNNMYKKNSKIKCNPKQKYQEQMIGMNSQALHKQLLKYQ